MEDVRVARPYPAPPSARAFKVHPDTLCPLDDAALLIWMMQLHLLNCLVTLFPSPLPPSLPCPCAPFPTLPIPSPSPCYCLLPLPLPSILPFFITPHPPPIRAPPCLLPLQIEFGLAPLGTVFTFDNIVVTVQ